MNDKPASLPYHDYASFLLRLWQKRNDHEAMWIASLQSTSTGESLSFPNMETFIHFLQTHFVAGQAPPDAIEPVFEGDET